MKNQVKRRKKVNLRPHGTGERETQGKVLDNAKLINTFQSPALFILHCGFGTLREILRLFDLYLTITSEQGSQTVS